MEQIKYRKTLDVHKNGTQFLLQGFETADKLSRVIEISLMASGDAIDFPLERIVAMMYVTTPGATEPSINECTIKDNKVVYEVLPVVEEGLTTMQLKLIETSPDGATSVLASPKFAVEVTKSDADDESAEQTTTFTALEDAMAKAKTVYDERFLRMELTSDCTFKAYYADGTVYETDILKKLFLNGNVLLSESFAHGGTGVRAGEDTDNSMYYSNVSKSESLNAKAIMENSEEILEEVKLHGMYTAFSVDFETGEVEYVSPSFKFRVNIETGELETEGQTYTFDDEVARVVTDWLAINGVFISDLQAISETYSEEISDLKETTSTHTEKIDTLENRVTPIEYGGTGADNISDAKENLEICNLSSCFAFIASQNSDTLDAAFGKNNEDLILDIGKQMAMYAWFKGVNKTEKPFTNLIGMSKLSDMTLDVFEEIVENAYTRNLVLSSPYAKDKLVVCYNISVSPEGESYSTSTASYGTKITVTEEDLTLPFHFQYYMACNYIRSKITLTIGTKTYSSIVGDTNKSITDGFIGMKEWSELGITKAGEYTVKFTEEHLGAINNSSDTTMSLCIIKMKG